MHDQLQKTVYIWGCLPHDGEYTLRSPNQQEHSRCKPSSSNGAVLRPMPSRFLDRGCLIEVSVLQMNDRQARAHIDLDRFLE